MATSSSDSQFQLVHEATSNSYYQSGQELEAGSLSDTLRIVTFNVEYARDPQRVAEVILGNENLRTAHVVLLQEVESHTRERKGRAEIIAERAGYYNLYAPARNVGTEGTHGIATLSKFPLQDIEVLSLPIYDLGFHTRRRIALTCTLRIGEDTIRLYNIHLDTRLNIDERIAQLRAVVDHADRSPETNVAMAGDFNTIPFRWLRRMVPIWYVDQNKKFDSFMRAKGFEESMQRRRGGLLRFSLDHIYTRGLTWGASGIEDSVAISDHTPLWADLKF